MSKHGKKPPPAEQDPDEAVTVNAPEVSPAPPDEEAPSQPEGYASGV